VLCILAKIPATATFIVPGSGQLQIKRGLPKF